MKESIKIFDNAQFGQIRTSVTESGEPLFCLADVCKALGLEQSHRVKPRLQQNGVEIGQNRLFAYLREKGYLCKAGERYNQPTQKSLDMGLFEIKKTVIQKPNGDTLISNTTKVTGKGQIYFVNRFLYEEANRKGDEIQRNIEEKMKGGVQ